MTLEVIDLRSTTLRLPFEAAFLTHVCWHFYFVTLLYPSTTRLTFRGFLWEQMITLLVTLIFMKWSVCPVLHSVKLFFATDGNCSISQIHAINVKWWVNLAELKCFVCNLNSSICFVNGYVYCNILLDYSVQIILVNTFLETWWYMNGSLHFPVENSMLMHGAVIFTLPLKKWPRIQVLGFYCVYFI